MTAIVVLGMHRSGTSCLAGMLAAAGLASAGPAVRNWDNARGHFEALDVVRLNDAVLAYSGGHWLSPPETVRWTEDQAATRDRLLRERIVGRPALLKDPRTLLTLPFWRASTVPFHAIGIVRHPLAVARSLQVWRDLPLVEGIALWLAHNRTLAADIARHEYPLIDFDQRKEVVVAAVGAACASFATAVDAQALAAAYEERLVHHDEADAPAIAGLEAAEELFASLTRATSAAVPTRQRFPRAAWDAFIGGLHRGAVEIALSDLHAALAGVDDVAAVLVPAVAALLRHRLHVPAREFITAYAAMLDAGLADLLHGKVLLAAGDAAGAARHLAASCAVPQPFFQARHLLPQALRQAGRHAEARTALARSANEALYPHGPLSTLAEWCWLDGDHLGALQYLGVAIEAAPAYRRGRLRTRRAEWLQARGELDAARSDLEQALVEDPAYQRAAEVLASLH